MKEEFEKLAAAGKIEGRHVAALTATGRGRLLHASQLGLWTHQDGGHGVRAVHD
jgi:hypothetical protein